ncbi:MAG TPA: hypothetical protein VGD35_23745, partial [Chitinophaga sp.]
VCHKAPEEKKVQGVQAPLEEKVAELHLTNHSAIQVMSAIRQSKDTTSNGEAVPACKDWNLSDAAILTILKNGKAMNAHDFHYLYDVLPCEIDGVVEIDSSRYNYTINAGSFFLLYDEDSTYYFECREPAFKKFFLVDGGDPGKVFNEP